MPRFLTPPRIGVLLLIELYLLADLHQIDHNGAARVLEFIAKHTTLTVEHDPQLLKEKKAVLTSDISAFRPHLQPIPLPTTDVRRYTDTQSFPSGTVWELFIIQCWATAQSGHQSLDELIDRMRASDLRIRTQFAW